MLNWQKTYIEKNIDLIEENRWEEFFHDYHEYGGGMGTILQEAGISFLPYLNEIPNRAFENSKITEFIIPENITGIGEQAYMHCSDLVNVVFPTTLEKIEDWAFMSCKSLKSVNLPGSVKTLGTGVFSGCSSLESVSLSSKLEKIPGLCFHSAQKLITIDIPSSVTQIEFSAFKECLSLRDVNIPSSIIKIGEGAFSYCSQLNIIYGGTRDDWKKLLLTGEKIFLHTKYICTCTDGVIKKSR